LRRSSIFFLAAFVSIATACGDDSSSSTGDGGGSSSTSATATTGNGAPSSSSSSTGGSTSDGGGGSTSDGGGGPGGAPGTGGSGGAGGAGTGGAATLPELCEELNDLFVSISEELKCPLASLGDCSEPFDCPDELRARYNCLFAEVSAEQCLCTGDPEELFCPTPDCDDEFDAYVACLDG
jgi:hypothetical protein